MMFNVLKDDLHLCGQTIWLPCTPTLTTLYQTWLKWSMLHTIPCDISSQRSGEHFCDELTIGNYLLDVVDVEECDCSASLWQTKGYETCTVVLDAEAAKLFPHCLHYKQLSATDGTSTCLSGVQVLPCWLLCIWGQVPVWPQKTRWPEEEANWRVKVFVAMDI